jgi:hypothetical protein
MTTLRPGYFLAIGGAILLAACSSYSDAPAGATLTIRASVSASNSLNASIAQPSRLLFGGGNTRAGDIVGDPASIDIGMYALYISQNGDCSNATLVQDHGTQATVVDFMQNPVLFTGSPAAGSYACIGVKLSDVISFTPKTSFGYCDSTQTYAIDIYRSDNTDPNDSSTYWRDIDLNAIAAHGTDAAPVDDHVLLLFTRDTAAALARGFNSGQTLQLGASLVVPGTQTFVWGGSGTVLSDSISTSCGLNPGSPTFE